MDTLQKSRNNGTKYAIDAVKKIILIRQHQGKSTVNEEAILKEFQERYEINQRTEALYRASKSKGSIKL